MHRTREKHASTRLVDYRIEICIKKNQFELYQMQTQERQPNPPTDRRPTPRRSWCTCVPIHPYQSRLFRALWREVPTKYLEKMVLLLHLPDNQSGTHRSCTVIGHRVISSCSVKIHCKTWLHGHHYQWHWNKLRWSMQWAKSIYERVGQS